MLSWVEVGLEFLDSDLVGLSLKLHESQLTSKTKSTTLCCQTLLIFGGQEY